jgi:hypothetical protein
MTMVYRHCGCKSFDARKFKAVKNEQFFFCKPVGGLWASPVREDGSTGWEEWCRSEDFHVKLLQRHFDFSLSSSVRLVTINALSDLQTLMERYAQTPDVRFPLSCLVLDFEKMSADYDAIELTDNGQCETRFSKPNLYGWDCESLLVLNPAVVVPEMRAKMRKAG